MSVQTTIRGALLEAKDALRRRSYDDSTPVSQARTLREAALLAEIHAAALDPRGADKDAVCALANIATAYDFSTMALLLCDMHVKGAQQPGQPANIAEALGRRAAIWGAIAEEFPRPSDDGVTSQMLWAYMSRTMLGIIGLISIAPPTQLQLYVREVNMLATENLQLSLMTFDDAKRLAEADGEDAALVTVTPARPKETDEPAATPSLIQVVSG